MRLRTSRFPFMALLLAAMLALTAPLQAGAPGKAQLLDRYYVEFLRPFLEAAMQAGLEAGSGPEPDFSACPAAGDIYRDMIKTQAPALMRRKFENDFRKVLLGTLDKELTVADLEAFLRFFATDEGKAYLQRLIATHGAEDGLERTDAWARDPALRSYQANLRKAQAANPNPFSSLDFKTDPEWKAMMSRFEQQLMATMISCMSKVPPAPPAPPAPRRSGG